MIAAFFGYLFLALAIISIILMLAANAALLFQVYQYFALREGGLAQEQRRLASSLPTDTELPHVVLQIPSFNEGRIVERAVANAIKLDWPKSKLHIQICDDSTDGTVDAARAAAAKAVAEGFDVAVFHRDDRTGFKAGALQAAMEQSPHQYFAILDVDFVSPPDFLRRCMTVLLGDEQLAFVQARGEFFNRGVSSFARAQSLFLDYHFALEQAARSWSGQTLPFNGTCGVWRRAALELAGGWQGDTLTEDWEQSYLIRLKGMRGTFVTTVTAAGELPEDLSSWLSQQRRWAKGIGQVAWKILPVVFQKQFPSAQERISTATPLLQWFLTLSFTSGYLFGIPAMILLPPITWPLGVTLVLMYLLTFFVIVVMMAGGSRAAGRTLHLPHFLVDLLPLTYIVLYVSWARFWSMPSIMLGRKEVFVRTPKREAPAPLP